MNNNLINQQITIQNTRADIIGELEAIIQYENHLDVTENPQAKQIIRHIVAEEKMHVGELFGSLFHLDPESKKQFELGYQEFVEGRK